MLNRNLLTIALLAVSAAAQTTAPAKSTTATKPATKPASQTVAPAAKTTAPPATKSTAAAKTTSPAKTTAAKAKSPATPKATATKAASPAKVKADIEAKVDKPSAEKKDEPIKTAGRRDPFVSPLRLQEAKAQSVVCTTGVRCLIIDQVVLKGIVKTQQGMIAMVENPAKKQYNLHEKDSVFNGQVMKITGDSLIFRENVTDSTGHQSTREVVKKVTAPVI